MFHINTVHSRLISPHHITIKTVRCCTTSPSVLSASRFSVLSCNLEPFHCSYVTRLCALSIQVEKLLFQPQWQVRVTLLTRRGSSQPY